MKHDGIEIPTHEQVAQVLDGTHPEVAKYVRSVNTDRNCWGDMLFMVQRDFPPKMFAQVILHLATRGWGPFIAETFCPYEGEIIALFEVAKKEDEKIVAMTFWERTKYYMQRYKEQNGNRFGCIDALASPKLSDVLKQTRQKWMKARGISNRHDPKFVDEIIKYLREKGENKCDE